MVSRTRKLVVGMSAIATLALIGGVVLVNVRGPSGPSAPLPRSNASATTVARAFLDAAVRRDCGSLRALSSTDDTLWCPSSAWERWQGDDPVMHSWWALRQLPDDGDSEQCFSFDIDATGALGMAPDSQSWGFCERHTGGGWRVSEEGQG